MSHDLRFSKLKFIQLVEFKWLEYENMALLTNFEIFCFYKSEFSKW